MKDCDNCEFNTRKYSDGFIFKDWSGAYEGDPSELPKVPDNTKFWTYQECDKNKKGLKHLNLTGDCSAYKEKK